MLKPYNTNIKTIIIYCHIVEFEMLYVYWKMDVSDINKSGTQSASILSANNYNNVN